MSPRRALPPALYRRFPFLQEILDGMPASVKVVDSNFHVVYANARALEEAGRDMADLRGRVCCQHLQGFKSNCPWCPVVKALEDGKFHVHSYDRKTPRGKRLMEVMGYLLPTRDGEMRYAVEITRDVTPIVSGELAKGPHHYDTSSAPPPPVPPAEDPILENRLGAAEKEYLVAALKRAGGDMGAAAREAGFSVKTLQRRLRKYGLDSRDYKR